MILNSHKKIITVAFLMIGIVTTYAQMPGEFQLQIEGGKFLKYDVSEMIDNKMPAAENEIKNDLRKHCPADIVIICESKDINKYKAWISKMDSMFLLNKYEVAFSRQTMDLADYNCNIHWFRISAMKQGLWSVHWQPADHENLKLYLYLTYDRKDTVLKKFDSLFTNKKLVSHSINFDVKKATIKPESTAFINDLADWLRSNPAVKLEIDGHTDNDGDSLSNMKLSLDRANEVKKQLVSHGVDEKRLTVKGFGSSKPLRPNNTPEDKANDRRVEFIKQ